MCVVLAFLYYVFSIFVINHNRLDIVIWILGEIVLEYHLDENVNAVRN